MEGTIAQIMMFAGNFAPNSWALCQGQVLSIAQNTALFSILGTTYGGNGQTNFRLPDFQGRGAVGTGQGPGLSPVNLGETFGNETVTLTTANLPVHTHTASVLAKVSNANPNTDEPAGSILTAPGSNFYRAANAANGNMGGTNTLTLAPTGSNIPFGIRQPYLGITMIICLFGVFPSRN